MLKDKEKEVCNKADKIKGVLTLLGLLSQVKESWILFLSSWKPLSWKPLKKNLLRETKIALVLPGLASCSERRRTFSPDQCPLYLLGVIQVKPEVNSHSQREREH